jgi:hypothetical protein
LLVIWQSPRICESLMPKKRAQGVSAAGQKMGIFAAELAKARRLAGGRVANALKSKPHARVPAPPNDVMSRRGAVPQPLTPAGETITIL